MQIFNFRKIEAKIVEEGAEKTSIRWLITRDMGAKNFAMRLFEMKPSGFSPFHEHPWEHEVFILEGKGIVRGIGEERSFKDGDVILILPDEMHQFINTSEKPVRFLCLIPYKY